ncbi:cytochrome c oxidase accessory protein CcoG [Propylenella binzhouense]|uniref:Cytochrome c oxidase accessory protein CcoG n=1 Tax=Propylenella binzhouense TaxID=2555902 RepID=A0A964WU71_9HYPH|nr:cytochrome c oxidase accessory protein CcoG [Propylenella binzhouense]MYZ48738.1 cytochrome c oxidase accessory protein CcoG [Propylenella binzhouense]
MTEQTYAAGGGVETIQADAVNSRTRRPLYAARVKIFPKAVDGFYRRLKWAILAVALAVYWITPWLRWDRGPAAPDQAVLVDLANRRFYFFFIEIWPQEFYYVAGLLIMAGLGLFLVTSVLGRAWCGYACPQTVWTDLYMAVERLVEGDRNARMRLDKAPWGLEKIRKRVTVHTLWILIAVATGGAWVFYFADAPTLLRELVTLQAAPVAYTTIAILTATTYVFAGFMREQVCTYMCPWPRIQGAMLDEDSLIVTYNAWRGEPRSRGQKKALAQGLDVGDCVDCNACVAVCPMGIDIRDGQQLECITCALCIDACNDIMAKVGKPRDLISYTTLRDYETHSAEARRAGRAVATQNQRRVGVSHVVRPRTILYFSLWSLIGLAMLFGIATRDRLDLNVLPDRNPLYVTLADGSIRNGYTVKILNMVPETRSFVLGTDGLRNAQLRLAEGDGQGGSELRIDVEPDRLREVKVFVTLPRDEVRRERSDFRFVVRDVESGETSHEGTHFHGPEQ